VDIITLVNQVFSKMGKKKILHLSLHGSLNLIIQKLATCHFKKKKVYTLSVNVRKIVKTYMYLFYSNCALSLVI